MHGYIGGAEEIGNYCENRISQESYEWVEAAYQTKTDLLETTLWTDAGIALDNGYESDRYA